MRQNWYPYADEPRSDVPAPLVGREGLGHVTAPAGWCAPVESTGLPREYSFEVRVANVSPEPFELWTGETLATDEVDS